MLHRVSAKGEWGIVARREPLPAQLGKKKSRSYPVPVLLDDGVEGSCAGSSLLSATAIVFGS